MNTRIILASASPRRKQLMKSAGIDCETAPAGVDESVPEGTPPRIACMYNALCKTQYTARLYPDDYVTGADTIVWNGRILGKPSDDQDAFETLSELRGRTHSVYTGVCIIVPSRKITRLFCERTDVTFGQYTDREILDYISSGEPADKAGSYAIQGVWAAHVRSVRGSRDNVIGLPVDRLREELVRLGVDFL